MSGSTWSEWLASLDEEKRSTALDLAATFRALGEEDPESWVRSEVNENIPQLATYVICRVLWRKAINWKPENVASIPAGARLLAAGADPEDVARVANLAAYEAINEALYRLTGENADPEIGDDLARRIPMWSLEETDSDFNPTGRGLSCLHETVGTMDPSGESPAGFYQ